MKRIISIFLAAMLLFPVLSIPAVAGVSDIAVDIVIGDDNSINASHQISTYSITFVPRGSGRVEVTVNIGGTHRQMTKIGFPSIAIFEQNNAQWRAVHSTGPHWNPNVPAGSHTHTFTFQGVAGRRYYASSSFQAQDAQGIDTRSANSPTITAT
jgi:hypothetical protein